MNYRKELGLHIKRKREALGVIAVQLAEEVGVTQRCIYKIEAGKSLPTWSVATRLLEVLGMSLEEVVKTIAVEGKEHLQI